MSDDIKIPGTEPENNDITPDAEAEQKLSEELEQLRDTFQAEYDKTKEEALNYTEEIPEIQQLEDVPDDTDGDDTEEDADGSASPAESGEKKKKDRKKLSKGIKALIAVLVIICVIISAELVTVILKPSLPKFAMAGIKAAVSQDLSEKISCYTEAKGYCEEEKLLEGFKQPLLEKIAVATCERDGYSAALTYISSNMTEEMTSAPKTKEFKSLLAVGDEIDNIAANAEEAVAAALNGSSDVQSPDYEKIARELGTPEIAADEVSQALRSIAEGIVYEQTGTEKEDFEKAVSAYLDAYYTFNSLGAKGQTILENTTVKLFDKGFAYEAQLMIDTYFDEEMLASPVSEDFSEVRNEIRLITDSGVDVYAAAAQHENGGASLEDLKASIAGLAPELPERGLLALAQMAMTVVEAMNFEAENNITKASVYYNTVLSAEESLKLPVGETAKKAFETVFALGDTGSAKQLADQYLTEQTVEASSDDFKKLYGEFTEIYAAQDAVNEVFYPYYYNVVYGEGIDKTEVTAALDELLTEDASYYTVAFVYYYKYLTEALTDRNNEIMEGYLDRFAADMIDFPMLYGYSQVQLYISESKYEQAIELTKKLLEINTGDDFGNSVLALEKRMQGDVQASLEAALKGIELSGERSYSAHQAAIDYLLLGNYSEAYDIAYELFSTSLTVDNCETLRIIAATYNGDDAQLKEALDKAASEVDATFEQYGVQYSENTQAVIDGEKTPDEIFMSGSFDVR